MAAADNPLSSQADAAPAPEQVDAQLRRFDGFLVGAVLIFAFLAASFAARNSDIFENLAVGRLVAEWKYRFGDDPFTFPGAQPGEGWINHSWLPSVFAYFFYSMHPVTLVVLKALLIVALAELMMRTGHQPGKRLGLPVVLTGLAVLAMSSRLLLQPTCLSYLFLAAALWLLERPRLLAKYGPGALACRWYLAPLFLVWVNCDQWFFLGPLTVALYLLGEAIQKADASRVKQLAAILGVGLIACLVNPYGYRAFAVPFQLGFAPGMDFLQGDAIFRRMTVTAYQPEFYKAGGQWNLPALAYFLLAFLGVVSFVLTWGAWRWWRLCIWMAFFLFSFFHSRAVPFFAVVAAPIAALNYLDFAVQRIGEAALTGDRGRRFLLAGRVLAVLALVALVTSAAIGKLQSQPLGWAVEVDPMLEQAARKIAANQGRQGDGDEAHWFNFSPDVVNYLAWFSPGTRGFMNYRLPLYREAAQDYQVVKKALEERGGPAEGGPTKERPWAPVFRKWGVRYLILNETNFFRYLGLLQGLLADPEQWPLLNVEGRTVVFGWQDPDSPSSFQGQGVRLERLAFGPDVKAVPGNLQAGPVEAPEWWSILLKGEKPRSPLASEATAYLAFFDASQQGVRKNQELSWDLAFVAGLVGVTGGVGGPGANGALDRVYFERQLKGRILSDRDRGPPAMLYLALRTARRALAENPLDARCHLLLAQAYLNLQQLTRESAAERSEHLQAVRKAQITAALQRALALDPNLHDAHLLLYEVFALQFPDVAFKHRKAYLDGLKADLARASGDGRKNLEQRIANLEKQVGEDEKKLETVQNQIAIHSANQNVLNRASLAERAGLANRALEILQKVKPEELQKAAGNQGEDVVRILRMRLLMRLGRFDELRDDLRSDLEGKLGFLQGLQVPELGWYQLLIAAAAGEYEAAEEHLSAMETLSVARQSIGILAQMSTLGPNVRDVEQLGPAQVGALLLGQYLLREATDATRLGPPLATWIERYGMLLQEAAQQAQVRLPPLPRPKEQLIGVAVQGSRNLLLLQANLRLARGVLALEAGNTDRAREHFQRVVTLLDETSGTAPRPLVLARMYLGWLDAAGQ